MFWLSGLFLLLLNPSLILSSTVLSTGGFPKGFLNSITESAIVKARLSSRWKWEVWDIVPGTHVYHIYVFNVTNPDEVEQGGKPRLQQVGPYTYVEHRIKFNVCINLELSVNFERNYTYSFHPELSNGSEEDLVNALNVPFVIFSTIVAEAGAPGSNAVNNLVKQGERLIKRKLRVADLIFDGMDVSAYEPYLKLMGSPSSDLVQEFVSGKYGVLKLKRGAHEKPFTVSSGLRDTSQSALIITWNGEDRLHWWAGPSCNNFTGATDGSEFPPHLLTNGLLRILDLDMCREIQFMYSTEAMFHDTVEVWNFELDPQLLADPRNYSQNMCFCKSPEACLKAGVLDVSSCKDGAPYVISFPHFYGSDPEYLEAVTGLTPIEGLHKTHINVEQRLGVVSQYWKRFQWNMRLQPLKNLDYFRNINNIIFPILWNDDNFQLNQDKADLLIAELANQDGGMWASGAGLLKGTISLLVLALAGALILISI